MKTRLAALAVLLAASARADMAVYFAQPLERTYSNACVSANGYHYAVLVSGKNNDEFIVDGRAIAKAPPGRFAGSSKSDCALSDDAAVLLHVMRIPPANGHAGGLAAAINGKPFGNVVQDVTDLNISPDHAFAVYVAHTAGGYQVVTSRGNGPLMDTAPRRILFGPSSIDYLQDWKGTKVIYRDNNPVESGNYHEIAAPPDLSRLAVLRSDVNAWTIELDGKTQTLPTPRIKDLAFSANGRHFGYFHGQEVIVDGKSIPAPTRDEQLRNDLTLSPAGVPYWVVMNDKGFALFRSGNKIATAEATDGKIEFSPNGTHEVLFGNNSAETKRFAFIDGKSPMEIPNPLRTYLASSHNAKPVFDSEDEFHFMAFDGERVELVCVALGKTSARRGPCAQTARRLGLKARAERP